MKNIAILTAALGLHPILQAVSAEPLPEDIAIFGDGTTTPEWIQTVEGEFPYELQILSLQTDTPIPKKKFVEGEIKTLGLDVAWYPEEFEVPIITEELEAMADIFTIAVEGNSQGIVQSKGEFSIIYKISQDKERFKLSLMFRKTLPYGRQMIDSQPPTLILNSPWTCLSGLTSTTDENTHKDGTVTSGFRELVFAARIRTRQPLEETSTWNSSVSPNPSVPFSLTDQTAPDS